MSEQAEVIADLSTSRVLSGITWAVNSAYAETMRDWDPRRGYGPGWIGYTAHGLIGDRMDRVFSCGDFHLPAGLPADAGMEAVQDGMHPDDFLGMPRLAPGLVTYSPLNNSPGWQYGSRRWLLQSFQFGRHRKIAWAAKSATKRRVASHPDPDQIAAFDITAFGSDTFTHDPVCVAPVVEDGVDTFVVAHSIHKELKERELFFGRPRIDRHQAWHWYQNLMKLPPESGGGVRPGYDPQPYTPNPNEVVSDAPVRLRFAQKERNRNETSG